MERSDLEIQNLIRECIRNNERSQLKLYKLYAKAMFNTCLRIVKNTTEAEDIVQESFLSAFLSLKDFRYEVPFKVWLRRIIINKSLDYYRKQKKSLIECTDNIADTNDFSEIENELASDGKTREKLVQHIKDEVMLLPDGYRVIFSLFYFEGYDHDEISEIMNISASTSRSQLTRAKQRIINNLTKKYMQNAG
jgi:RNA polymerase sigma-70 factor (ECF subfamily)